MLEKQANRTLTVQVMILSWCWHSRDYPCSQALMHGRRKESLAHCLCMCQVSLVTCILLCYTKINENFCLSGERPHCRNLYCLWDTFGGFKVRNNIALMLTACISSFKMIGKLQLERLCQSRATDTWIIPVSEELITPLSSSTQSMVSGRHLSGKKSWHVSQRLV